LIVEGIAFRIVTSSHPGDPALEEFGCPRTEYVYSTDPLRWTMKRDEAIRFPTHRDAEKFAEQYHFHAAVAGADEQSVPERLRPMAQDLPPPLPTIRNRGRKKKRGERAAKAVVTGRRDWVKETYG